MKRLWILVGAVACFSLAGQAQFKAQMPNESRPSITQSGGSIMSSLFGWFDPERFHMRHSIQMSYQTLGAGGGFSLGTYTNSMLYQVTDNLNARADVSFSFSPYNTFSKYGGAPSMLNKVYLSRAEINYRPMENMLLQVQYRQLPFSPFYYNPFYYGNSFYDPFRGDF